LQMDYVVRVHYYTTGYACTVDERHSRICPSKMHSIVEVRLTPTRKCNLERQIQLCLTYTVAASLMLQLPSSIIKCISERHS
jgi:hypothetical protein